MRRAPLLRLRRRPQGLPLVLAAAALAACTLGRHAGQDAEALRGRYAAAVQDAAAAEPAEVRRDLDAVVESNRTLIWSPGPGPRRVLVVTWAAEALGLPGERRAAPADLWVTLAPAVRERCRAFAHRPAALALRLEQLLGLPPATAYTVFNELWVEPRDLFRPCPDPEIEDTACELDVTASASDEHRRWFERTFAASYPPPIGQAQGQGYPWTRLGYTYDWGSRNGEVGLAELGVRDGAPIELHRVASTADYCR